MQNDYDSIAKSLLSFNASKPYFGGVSSNDLNNAWATLKKTGGWNNPTNIVRIKATSIEAKTVLETLWTHMQLNPVRWGEKYPFGGRGIIYFCNNVLVHMPHLQTIKDNLYNFLRVNAKPNHQWSDDVLIGKDGFIEIAANSDGHPNNNYRKMRLLFDCVKEIAKTNTDDFMAKRGPYRNRIIDKLALQYPAKIKLSDFGLVLDAPLNEQLDIFKSYDIVKVRKFLQEKKRVA